MLHYKEKSSENLELQKDILINNNKKQQKIQHFSVSLIYVYIVYRESKG